MSTIVERDIIEYAKTLPDTSMQCIIADPPYNIGKDFGISTDNQKLGDYIKWCEEWIKECERILTPTGTGFIYGFSEILAHLSVKLSLPHRWLIWHYTNKNTAGSNFWQRSHESIIVFWKDSKKRIFNEDEVREPYTETFLKNSAGKIRKGTKGRLSKNNTDTIYTANELGAKGRDVIKVPALAGGAGAGERIFFCHTCNDIFIGNKRNHSDHEIIEHPTQKPQKLTMKLLKSCLMKSDDRFLGSVYIPFAGSGSECLCCQWIGVPFYSSDINPEYVRNGNLLLKKFPEAI
ncbi:MAG TPA: site-specific DNA-methyltransferase [Bacteroidales bacterium]|nr:site-specific DNA-methyltransferase [Bacteroidales bacterium]